MTKSQINKLGEKLRKPGRPEQYDLVLLQELRSRYDGPRLKVEARLRLEMGLESTTRLKTPNTIIEKLRRDRTRLATMQDIAGVRIVTDLGLAGQHVIVEKLSALFPSARVEDRRVKPNHGYRAVHVIPEVDVEGREVRADGYLVEIQVRTLMQDLWAQTMEKLADELGRGIRYGDIAESGAERVAALLSQSETIYALEEIGMELQVLEAGLKLHPTQVEPSVQAGVQGLRSALNKQSALVRSNLYAILGLGGSFH